jgi:hypothetical protein
MTTIIKPTKADLDKLVAPYLKTQPSGLAFAIGYASPQFSPMDLSISTATRPISSGSR